MSIIPSAAPNDTTTTVPDEDSHEAAVARYLSTPYTDDATPAPMTPDSVRTDALQPGDQIRHPHDWTLFTVGAAAERLDDLGSPLDFRNRETDEFERGMRVTGTDASGETVHVDTAPSYLWHREGQQKTARDKLATAVAEHGPFPMPTGDTVPALTEAALEAKVYDSLVSFNGVACWDILRLAQMRQYLAEHVAADLVPELDRLRTQVAELEAQRERRRARLVALQNDALSMRGSLSPNGEASKVPFELGETLTPAVDWLINRVAELEAATCVAPSPSCTRCYGADAVRFVANGGTTAPCRACAPSELEQLRAQVAELEAQRDRRRARLVALQNDALSMRGSLSPNGEAREVPFELGETLTPAVDWLINRVAELEADLADATEPDVDGAGRTCEEYYPVPAPRDLRPGADAARRTIRDRQVAEGSRAPRQVAPVEAFAYEMDQALVDLSTEERRGADLVLQVLRARATAADVPTAEATS